MGNVHFVDTSVLVELLDVPKMNQHHAEAAQEYKRLSEKGDIFVLPFAVLIETGNHIAHIPDGNLRRKIAETFVDVVKKAIRAENQWSVAPAISVHVLEAVLDNFPDKVLNHTGIGDVSIVEQFEDYWKNKQPIGTMRIWSFDKHLSSYSYTGGLSRRKYQ